MTLNPIEIDYCLETTKYFKEHDLSSSFLNPVNTDIFRDYKEIVKHPMDLTTLENNLRNNKYRNSKDWADDLMRIWDNAIKYNKKYSNCVYYIAKIMKTKTEKKIEFIPKNETDLWYIKLKKAANKVEKELNKSSRSSSKSKHNQ